MKRTLTLLLVLVLCIGVLSGCGTQEAAVSHTYEDLTISLPADFIDLSDEDFAEGLDFVYGLDPIAVNGLREKKATFEAYGLELDLESYGKFVIKANNISGTLEQKDGIWTFTYESGDYTYVVTLWETEKAYWTVQAYCPTENYSKVKKDMWEILSSVTV